MVAITRHGIALAGRVVAALPGARLFAPRKYHAEAHAAAPGACACYEGKVGAQVPALFANFDGLVAIVSLGAVVRLIAPHLKDKDSDPGVVVLDEAARWAIPVLSGHLGGANAIAAALQTAIGATAVLTTASDARGTLAVDLLGRELGWSLEASHDELVRASAAMVNDEAGGAGAGSRPPRLVAGPRQRPQRAAAGEPALLRPPGRSRARVLRRRAVDRPPHAACRLRGTPGGQARDLSPGRRASMSPPPSQGGAAPAAPAPSATGPGCGTLGRVASLPVCVALGLGCDRGTPAETIAQAVAEALTQAAIRLGTPALEVTAAASITLKADEAGLLEVAAAAGWALHFYDAERLAGVTVPNPSATVRRYTGTPSVSEAAALLAAGTSLAADPGALLVEEHRLRGADGRNATVSIARMPR